MANESLFRKKAMESMSTPEQLNDYLRVTGPGVWMVLAAVIVLLMTMIIWGVVGRIETTLTVTACAQDGRVVCYVPEDEGAGLQAGMPVRIDGEEFVLSSVPERPVPVDGALDEYAMHVSGLSSGMWMYPAEADADLPDGLYQAKIVTESLRPMSFLTN